MPRADYLRRYGRVFDAVADDYDAARRGYPDALVDMCVARGGLHAGSRVVEVGSGTGKLTELLAARGLEVLAVEPGANMVAAARRRLGSLGARVRFEVSTFEQARLPEATFAALFSATAFHWIDPQVGWRKAALHLEPDGLLALLAHLPVQGERSAEVDEALRSALTRHAPDVAADWKPPLGLDALLAGAEERLANASEAWDWLTGERHGMSVDAAASLFGDVRADAVVERVSETADQAITLLRTTSLYFRIAEDRRSAFETDVRVLIDRLGGTLDSSLATVLMTARRRATT